MLYMCQYEVLLIWYPDKNNKQNIGGIKYT